MTTDPFSPDYQLTARDHQRQRDREASAAYIDEIVKDMPLPSEETIARVVAIMRAQPWPPDPAVMSTWRQRLYCGHIIETQQHYTNDRTPPIGPRACPECGMAPVAVIAAKLVKPGGVTP